MGKESQTPNWHGTHNLEAYFQVLGRQGCFDKVELRVSNSQGRHLVAKTIINPGECIFVEEAVIECSEETELCLGCGLEHGDVAVCTKFGQFIPLRPAIAAVDSISERTGTAQEDLRKVIKFIASAADSTSDKTKSARLDALGSVFSLLPANAPSGQEAVLYGGQKKTKKRKKVKTDSDHEASGLLWSKLPGLHKEMFSIEQLVQLLRVNRRNAHEILGEDGTIGSGLFPLTAMINHSCFENCGFTAFFARDGSPARMTIMALSTISPGEQIFINYGEPYSPFAQRQEYLKEKYYFVCECRICGSPCRGNSETSPDLIRAFVCSKRCATTVYPCRDGKNTDEKNRYISQIYNRKPVVPPHACPPLSKSKVW